MAERKSALKRAPSRPALDALLKQSRERIVSDETLRAQMASFIYGNAPEGSKITKESAAKATTRIRLLAKTEN